MPEQVNVQELTQADDPALNRVTELFIDMYHYMNEHGLLLPLAEGGEKKWLEGILKGLGRFGTLLIAETDKDVIGFAHGSIRLAPDYLGNKKLGLITHIYVDREYRGRGVGESLVKKLEKWFKEKDVHSVELQVLAANKSGIAFWEKLGYPVELLQHRKAAKEL